MGKWQRGTTPLLSHRAPCCFHVSLPLQEDLEEERSRLLTRVVVAEEQVSELQEYIDKHLAR